LKIPLTTKAQRSQRIKRGRRTLGELCTLKGINVFVVNKKIKNEKGYALLTVLIILAIMTPLVVNLSYKTMVQITGADYLASKIKSREIARAGLESAILALKKDNRDYDSYLEEWGEFRELSVFSATFFEEGSFTGTIRDEEGKINVNRITAGLDTKDQLTRLFDIIKVDADILDAITDWIDSDNEAELTGAEDNYYSTLDNPYYSRDAPMNNIYELRLIKGVTDDIFLGRNGENPLYNYLSTYGSDGRVNINTANDEVILSLSKDLPVSVAEEIIDYRRGEPFKSADDVKELIGEKDFKIIQGKIKVVSNTFSVTVRGIYRDIRTDIHAVISRQGDNAKIIYYSEA